MLKVYFVGSGYGGCNYVRLFIPMLANGWRGAYQGISKNSLKDPKLVMKEMLESDVIVFHRANTNWHHRIGEILKQAGKKIVFDNDDTFILEQEHPFYGLDEKGFEQNKERMNNVINNFIINSDLVTTSTEFLAKEYRKIHDKVVVLPNCVDPDDWSPPLKNETDKVRIGFVGSVAYNHDFEGIKKVIKKLDEDNKIQVVLFGLWGNDKRKQNKKVEQTLHKEFAFWDTIKNKEQVSWRPIEQYFDTLNELRLDMMLIPRRENYFNKCKSNIKFLEAGMLEIPVIAQGFIDSPYEELDGENGILIKDNKDWYDEIMSLVNNKSKRLMIGATARKYVLDNYAINNHKNKWQEVYENINSKR